MLSSTKRHILNTYREAIIGREEVSENVPDHKSNGCKHCEDESIRKVVVHRELDQVLPDSECAASLNNRREYPEHDSNVYQDQQAIGYSHWGANTGSCGLCACVRVSVETVYKG